MEEDEEGKKEEEEQEVGWQEFQHKKWAEGALKLNERRTAI